MAHNGGDKGWSAPLSLSHLLRHNREELFYIAADPLSAPAMAARRLAFRMRGVQPTGYLGWIGHRNLGDEAMYQVIRQALAASHVTPFTAPAGELFFARLGLGGRAYFRSVLLGGGTLINPLFLQPAKVARTFGAPVHTVGTGVGSPGFGMPHKAALEGWAEIFRDSLLSVRGPLSLKLLHDAGLKQAVIIGDPALGMTPAVTPALRVRKRLVINLAREPGKQLSPAESTAFGRVGALAAQFSRDGGEVLGVALGNGDRAALRDFRKEHGLARMTIENHRTSGEGLLRAITGSVGMIGVRLHAAVLACCVGLPSILLAYRSKCEDFMASMELSDFAIPLDPDSSGRRITACWDRIVSEEDLGGRIHSKALFWKQRQGIYYNELAARIRQGA